MKTPDPARNQRSATSVRAVGIAFGMLGLAVAAWQIPEAWRGTSFTALSARLMMREPFRPEVLRDFSSRADRYQVSNWCSIPALRASALLRATTAEAALGDGSELDGRLEALKASANALVSCSPFDGFGWFALYWSALNQHGVNERSLAFLGMSYDTAPREAWIALMRNQAAIRALPLVSWQIKAAILEEWRDLVKAGLYDHAARTLAQADNQRRKQLIAAISDLDPSGLRWLSVHAGRMGLELDLGISPAADSRNRDHLRPFRSGS